MTYKKSALQHEIHQSRPFRSPSQEAVLGLFRTADILRREFDRVMAEHGLTQQQYNVLRILRGAGEEGLPTLVIAERMIEPTPGITRLLDRLEKKGWVERHRTEQDRRRVICRIHHDGLDVLDELDAPLNSLDDRCLAMISDDEIRQIIGLLDRVRAFYRQDREPKKI